MIIQNSIDKKQNESISQNNSTEVQNISYAERYQNLFDTLPIGIYKSSPDGKILQANNTLVKILGYDSLEELMQQDTSCEIYANKTSRSDFIEKIDKENEVIGFESIWLKKNNDEIWVRENSKVIKDENNNVLYYEGTVEDITTQKKAEENLEIERLLFIDGPVIIIKWRVDSALSHELKPGHNLSIEYISPNVTQVLGFSFEELTNNLMHFHSLIHPDDLDRIYNETNVIVDKGQAWYQQEYRLMDKNGKYKWYFDFTRIIRNSEGNVINYHGYLFDISARKEAEEALLVSEKQLRALNTMKDKFFSVIAHDLRSPFQGLLGMASILVDDEFDLSQNERRDFTRKLYEGLKTQFTLLDNLLTWSRLQRGVIEFVPSLNDLVGDIQEACAILNSSIEKKSLNLVTDIPKNMLAFYDKNMVATVIRNLLSNAIKFTHENGTIIISVSEKETEFTVTVKDTGIGIQEENIAKLFRIDSLCSTRGTNDEGGTGLGLILCKEFVEKHNGRIWVESEFGKGSTLYFTIPKLDKTNS